MNKDKAGFPQGMISAAVRGLRSMGCGAAWKRHPAVVDVASMCIASRFGMGYVVHVGTCTLRLFLSYIYREQCAVGCCGKFACGSPSMPTNSPEHLLEGRSYTAARAALSGARCTAGRSGRGRHGAHGRPHGFAWNQRQPQAAVLGQCAAQRRHNRPLTEQGPCCCRMPPAVPRRGRRYCWRRAAERLAAG